MGIPILLVSCILFLGSDLTLCEVRYFEPGISSIDPNSIEEAKRYSLWIEDPVVAKQEIRTIKFKKEIAFISFIYIDAGIAWVRSNVNGDSLKNNNNCYFFLSLN